MKPLSTALVALLILASITAPVRAWCLSGACDRVVDPSDCCAKPSVHHAVDASEAAEELHDADQEPCSDCIPGVHLPVGVAERSVDPPSVALVVEAVIWPQTAPRYRTTSMAQRFPTGPPPPAALLRDQRCIRLLI